MKSKYIGYFHRTLCHPYFSWATTLWNSWFNGQLKKGYCWRKERAIDPKQWVQNTFKVDLFQYFFWKLTREIKTRSFTGRWNTLLPDSSLWQLLKWYKDSDNLTYFSFKQQEECLKAWLSKVTFFCAHAYTGMHTVQHPSMQVTESNTSPVECVAMLLPAHAGASDGRVHTEVLAHTTLHMWKGYWGEVLLKNQAAILNINYCNNSFYSVSTITLWYCPHMKVEMVKWRKEVNNNKKQGLKDWAWCQKCLWIYVETMEGFLSPDIHICVYILHRLERVTNCVLHLCFVM